VRPLYKLFGRALFSSLLSLTAIIVGLMLMVKATIYYEHMLSFVCVFVGILALDQSERRWIKFFRQRNKP